MKFGKYLAAAAVAVPLALCATLAVGGAAHAAPVPVGYAAQVGNVPVTTSALGVGSSATVNPAGTLTLIPGTPASSTYAEADLSLPAGSVLPLIAPTFVTSGYAAGSPRWVIKLANGGMLFNEQSGTAGDGANPLAADWAYNTGSGWSAAATYLIAVSHVGGFGQAVSDAYLVADGDQPAGTADVLSLVQYGGQFLKVTPLFAPVPRLSKGHAVELTPAREDVYFTQSGAASWDHFTIVGPGAINGHQGWVNGKIGLNAAVYGGLEAHHTYTVFYQPVTSQGGTTPVPGSHIGYVVFVS